MADGRLAHDSALEKHNQTMASSSEGSGGKDNEP